MALGMKAMACPATDSTVPVDTTVTVTAVPTDNRADWATRPAKRMLARAPSLARSTTHTVPAALTRRDLSLMKAHNLNAVRASHYPHDEHFAELADITELPAWLGL